MSFECNLVFDCSILNLSKLNCENGSSTVIENETSIPFRVKRVYYLFDVPSGESRGGHAHRGLMQLIVAVRGSFKVVLNDGFNSRALVLDRPNSGLFIVPGIWRELVEFSFDAVCLVLASDEYSETDYIRDYNEFKICKYEK